MNHKKLHALFGLKWNPFTPDVPTTSLWMSPSIHSFCTRVEHMAAEGGFALVAGEPGTGKSITLRLLHDHLSNLPDVTLAIISRPQSGLTDFYRELGELFAVDLRPHNRWGGFKTLRERWKAHAETSLLRPVLLVDEAQEMPLSVLNELRILASAELDTVTFLTTVIAGDQRLLDHLRTPDLLPFSSRIRTRLLLDYASKDDLHAVLKHGLEKSGNATLFPKNLAAALVEHAAGNLRALMTIAGELLLFATEQDRTDIDEQLFFELYKERAPRRPSNTKPRPARAR
jgi:type II secretory pathway predicted ATPase ExeA